MWHYYNITHLFNTTFGVLSRIFLETMFSVTVGNLHIYDNTLS